ncbi:MAG: chromosome segregation protein SMC, partial [Anaerovoracaceae bacterium]
GLTCIVGPNGSGKSNISDAVRWVLGEQSPKTLRGGKMEEVIFSGTDSRKSRGMAEVTLVIDNENGSLPIDYKEVALTRRMFRTGESEYRINGNQCRLRDIRDLIMDTGIGVDGYSIIGQGKISDILSTKTDSRREIFEEAAGIVMYRTKKSESERKLESTSANMERVNDIIGELEGRIGTLRKESAKAREYIGLRDRHRELEINITLKNIENIELKNEYIIDDIAELTSSIESCDEKSRQLEKRSAESSDRHRELEELSTEAREKLMTVIEQLNESVNREQLDREKLTSIEENQVRLRGEMESLGERKAREQAQAGKYSEKSAETEVQLSRALETLREKKLGYEAASGELDSLTRQMDDCKNDIYELSGMINSGKAEINSLQRLQEQLEARRELLIKEKISGEDNNKETLDRLGRLRNQRDQILQELDETRERLTDSRQQLDESRKRERQVDGRLEELKISSGKLSARLKTIEEMESNYEGYNHAVRHVMKSGIKGIDGVVADLIEVPRGYETAMETALGASLQNIVCEDDGSAKAAIRSLKENRAGRMTFLPVSSVRGRAIRDRKLEKVTGFIGFGPDCLSCDDRYRGIMEYLLGRVVIVDEMDNALKMSKIVSNLRFVTLDGDVINAGGAITGGRYKNRTANILDRKAETAELRQKVASSEDEIRTMTAELEKIRSEISGLEKNSSRLEEEVSGKNGRLMAAENEMKLAESALADMRSGSDKLDRELENIDKEKEKSGNMIREIKEKIENAYIEVKEAERLGDGYKELHETRKAQFDMASEEITKARISVTELEREKEHAAAMAARVETAIEEIRRDMEAKEQELADLDGEKERMISSSGSAADIIRQKEEEKKRLEEYIAELSEEKTQAARASEEVASEKEALNVKLSELRNRKYELEIKKAKNETQLDTYKNKLWDDFEVSYVQAVEFKSDEFVMSAAAKENRQIKNRLGELGEVNIGAIEEYETVRERYDFLVSQREDIREAADGLSKMIGDMDKTIKTRFKESFDRIVDNFERKFKELFGGGHAELRLSDENDPLGSDIDIIAQPPGKRLQNINLLSGGEKTLTAIALMFAVLEAKPTPFCILDEVEAALDDVNIDRFINCLREFTGVQFALVTHQKATMEHADVLYGITMPEKGVSKVLSLSLDDDFEI